MIKFKYATSKDSKILFSLIQEMAIHHKQEANLKTNDTLLGEAISNNKYNFEIILAYLQEKPVGYLSYYHNYSIWLAQNYLLIDDLFILEGFRGKNIGNLFMDRLKSTALELNISQIRWEVEIDNIGAIKFYKNLGAQFYDKGIFKWNIS